MTTETFTAIKSSSYVPALQSAKKYANRFKNRGLLVHDFGVRTLQIEKSRPDTYIDGELFEAKTWYEIEFEGFVVYSEI